MLDLPLSLDINLNQDSNDLVKKSKICVIGAGISGLIAAYELKNYGHKVKIFEADTRYGGRIWSYKFDNNDHCYGELGAMRFHPKHKLINHYIHKLGLADKIQQFISGFNDENCYIQSSESVLRLSTIIDQLILKKTQPIFRQKLRDFVYLIVEHIAPNNFVAEFVQNANIIVTDDIVKAYRLLLPETILELNNTINLGPRLRTDLLLGKFIPQIMCNPKLSLEFKEFYQDIITEISPSLLCLKGGMSEFTKALANTLTSELHLNTPVYKIKNGIEKVAVTYQDNNNMCIENFDYVICTIPASVLATLILENVTARKIMALKEVKYVNTTKTIIKCRENFWVQNYFINGGASFVKHSIKGIFYPTNHNNSFYNTEGVLLNYLIGAETDIYTGELQKKLLQDIIENVATFHPEFNEDMIVEYKTVHWQQKEWIKGGCCFTWPTHKAFLYYHQDNKEQVPSYLKNIWDKFEAAVAPEGRLIFAGEHCSHMNAWMEGAIISSVAAIKYLQNNIKCNALDNR